MTNQQFVRCAHCRKKLVPFVAGTHQDTTPQSVGDGYSLSRWYCHKCWLAGPECATRGCRGCLHRNPTTGECACDGCGRFYEANEVEVYTPHQKSQVMP